MTRPLFVYKRHGALDYLVRADLGDSFLDKGDETPGALWVRLGGPYPSYAVADAEAEQFEREGRALEAGRPAAVDHDGAAAVPGNG